jgi:hypothetical protein
MCLHSLELTNLNVRSENPFAHFEESSRTITKIFMHKLSQLLAKKIPIGFQTAQPKKKKKNIARKDFLRLTASNWLSI